MLTSLRRWTVLFAVLGLLVSAPAFGQRASKAEKPNYEAALSNLEWRSIGPANMGGRVDDFAVVESNPSTMYVATASGGVWKTTNSGTTWEPIFDNEAVSTIGDVTVAPSDPCTIWVGTGEPNNRQSSSWGNGVYKSADCGKTWANVGLKETHHIGRIVVHPANPSVAYVAAVGRLWGPSRERGIFKTSDGGKTWQHALFLNEDTGAVDVAMDWESPDTLYAAMYQRRRTVFGFNGCGPHSAIHKTTDGGATWTKLTKGLPYEKGEGETGRIGVNVYRRNTNVVYALVEHKNGGIYRSDDKGATWTKMSDTNPRPMYYSKVHIDPNNDLRIWVLGAPLYHSEDGGRTFRTLQTRIHGDYHALWINPANSNHMMIGSDGGIHWSYDNGRTWDFVNTISLSQFYEIGVDMQSPYYVCGGLQDNGSWCGPSRTWWQQGISNDEWFRVGGGDGFFVQIDYSDHNIVYSESQDGNLRRMDLRANESKSIRPREAEGEARLRFQWNSPIVISAHDPKTIYYGGNFLFKSTNRGDDWTKISPDLTTGQERDKLPIMGKVPDAETRSRHDGVQQWPTITTVSESTLSANVLWVGTDDGNLQVTRDGGKNWKNVADKVPGVPKGTYVSRVVASRHAEGTAYATFDGHRMNDFNIYVFLTADFGETWKAISSGIPANGGIVNVIREHHRNANLLFAGTEYGAYFSLDRGANWSRLKMNLPTVPVDDIAIHPRENDLIFGTHGRGVWVLDDITPLEQLDDKVMASDLHLFDIRPATQWRVHGHKGNTGHKIFLGENPAYGALIHFYLKAAPGERERMRITITDKDGKTVRDIMCGPRPQAPAGGGGGGGGFFFAVSQIPCDPKPGINRVNWDLRYNSPVPPGGGPGGGGGGGGGFGGGAGRGASVDPGEYTVKISLGQKEVTKTVRVDEDPRIQISPEDRTARRAAINRLTPMMTTASRAQRGITGLRTALSGAIESWKRPGSNVPEAIVKQGEEMLKKVEEVCLKFANRQQCTSAAGEGLGTAGPPLVFTPPPLPNRIGQLMFALDGYTAAPSATQLEDIDTLSKLLEEAAPQVRKLVEEELVNLNKKMNEAGIPHIRIQPPRGPGGGGPGNVED
jgi:photosystem II stability/assembly factor-like uncharacterized protein